MEGGYFYERLYLLIRFFVVVVFFIKLHIGEV